MTRIAAWWPHTWLIARREIDERLRARSYQVTTAIVVLAVAAAVVVPALVAHHHKTQKVGLVGPTAPAVTQAAVAAGRVVAERVLVEPVGSLRAARDALRSGKLSAVVVEGRQVLIKQQPLGGATSSAATFPGALAQLIGLAEKLPAGAASAALSHGVAIPIAGVEPPPKSLASRFTGLGVALLIYIVIFFYGMRITQSVGEEKSSRVVEVLLATARPTQLLIGKVTGFAVVAFTQILALAVTFAICAVAVNSHAIHGTAASVVPVGVLWLVLGFALYSTAFAAAGAMISRQSDAANASFPLLIPLIIAYSLTNGVLFNGVNSFYQVLAFIPWTAPIAMPTMVAVGAASVSAVIASALLCVLATVATGRLAGIIYQRSVMRTGARVRLRQVLRSSAG